MTGVPSHSNRDLLLRYLAPYAAYGLVAFLAQRFELAAEIDYALRIALCGGLLIWVWSSYTSLRGPRSPAASIAWGIVGGLTGLALWIALLAPFVEVAGEPWDDRAWALRLFAASALVPVFEELFIRGYIFRVALQWGRLRDAGEPEPFATVLDERSLDDVSPGEWTWTAIAISTAWFALGHAQVEWPASVAYSLVMLGLWIWRRDLLSCVVAHATTNLVLAVYVRSAGAWWLWS